MLNNKVIVVTGGGSGIGRAASQIMAKVGAKVLVTDYNGAGAEETAALITQAGGIAKAMRVDVTHESLVSVGSTAPSTMPVCRCTTNWSKS